MNCLFQEMRPFFFALLFVSVPALLSGFSFLEEGERLFMENKLEEAMTMFEAALNEQPENEKIYLYLSIIYENLDMHHKAVEILEEGLPHSGEHTARMYYNQGNNLYALTRYEGAEDAFSRAIKSRAGFADAYLNRANARLEQEKYRDAVSDYTLYLRMRPADPQREEIERLIGLLKDHVAEAEQRKREEEHRRVAEEKRRAEEEARRKALMEDVLDALEKAEQEESKMQAEAEDIEEFEFDLEPE
jgi:tetratricopeptide (TPR) repeat protein